MALLIKIDGSKYNIEPQNKAIGFTLGEVVNLIGTIYTERIKLNNKQTMIVPRNGDIWQHNPEACKYANQHLNHMQLSKLFGNALIGDRTEI